MSKSYKPKKAHKKFGRNEQIRLEAHRTETLESYLNAKALLEEWEPYEEKDPNYVSTIRGRVYRLEKYVANMGIDTE